MGPDSVKPGEVRYEISMTVDINNGKMCDWAAEYIEKVAFDQVRDGTYIDNVTMHEYPNPTEKDQEAYEYNQKLWADGQVIEEDPPDE